MRWVKCTPVVELVGHREGHCAAVLTAAFPDYGTPTKGGSASARPAPPPSCSQSSPAAPLRRYVLVCGGYCNGELTGNPIVSPVSALPTLPWVVLEYEGATACDGASLQAISDHEALLFGGLDVNTERTNELYSLQLMPPSQLGGVPALASTMSSTGDQFSSATGNDAPSLIVRPLATTGDVPPPRSRHGAGFSDGVMYIFGGETDTVEQVDDLYALTASTGVWRRITGTGAPTPPPRLLCLSLVFVAPAVFVVYGGCQFVKGSLQSLCDLWAFNSDTETWTDLTAAAGAWPPCNGHRGARVPWQHSIPLSRAPRFSHGDLGDAASAVFVGGKDGATGDDRVKLVHYNAATKDFGYSLEVPQDAQTETESEAREKNGRHRAGGTLDSAVAEAEAEEDEDEEEINSRLAHPHWRYTPVLLEVPDGLLVIGGHCRHPQRPSVYLLCR